MNQAKKTAYNHGLAKAGAFGIYSTFRIFFKIWNELKIFASTPRLRQAANRWWLFSPNKPLLNLIKIVFLLYEIC
jgi:hypothetical protein